MHIGNYLCARLPQNNNKRNRSKESAMNILNTSVVRTLNIIIIRKYFEIITKRRIHVLVNRNS